MIQQEFFGFFILFVLLNYVQNGDVYKDMGEQSGVPKSNGLQYRSTVFSQLITLDNYFFKPSLGRVINRGGGNYCFDPP